MARPRKSATKPAHPEQLSTAIHIGASAVSMLVATGNGDGTLDAVDFLEQPAPVARDIFRHGAISLATTERVVSIIRDFQKSLD